MRLVILLGFALFSVGCANSPSLPPPAAPAPIRPASFVSWEERSELTVLYREDRELPIVSLALFIPGGTLHEERPEVVSALAALLRTGGAGRRSPQAVDAFLEERAASISISWGEEFGTISMQALASDIDDVAALATSLITAPRFDDDRFALWKRQALERIDRRKDDPMTVASITFQQHLFQGTPLGRIVRRRDIERLTVDDLRAAHARLVASNGAYLTVTGAIGEEKARMLSRRFAEELPQRGAALPPLPEVAPSSAPAIVFIEQPLAQATVWIGVRGPTRHAKDQYATEVFNGVFGMGGFGSRLMRRVRSEAGLAYMVYGGVLPGVVRGQAIIVAQTKAPDVGETVVRALGELEQLATEGPSPQELSEAIRGAQNSWIFRFDDPGKAINREVVRRLTGFPDDFDTGYVERVGGVSRDEVAAVARTRWQLSEAVIVVVGPPSARESLEGVRGRLPHPLAVDAVQEGRFDELFQTR